MAQMSSPKGFGGSRGSFLPPLLPEEPSPYLAWIGRSDAPEPKLVVEFVGINQAQQRAAIGGFPGGKRFVLAAEED